MSAPLRGVHGTAPRAGGTREHAREPLVTSRHPLGDPSEAVAQLAERVALGLGGSKTAASEAEVSYPQFRKWVGDGDLPSLRQVLRLCELAGPHDPFRRALMRELRVMFEPAPPDPDKVAAEVERRLAGRPYAREAAEAARQALLFPDDIPSPPRRPRR